MRIAVYSGLLRPSAYGDANFDDGSSISLDETSDNASAVSETAQSPFSLTSLFFVSVAAGVTVGLINRAISKFLS